MTLLVSVYIDIIEYQNIGDVRAPVIKIIESERRLRKGSINTVTLIHHKTNNSGLQAHTF